jgi:hypothetical protein
MKFRKSMIAVMCAASLGAVSVPLAAVAAVDIYFNAAPPAARYEAVPAPRPGYVWSPGYWDGRNNRHYWQAGHWEHQRAGYHRVHPEWLHNDHGWQLQRGRWNADRDHDGVPNTRDRAPDNPNRY